MSIIIDGAYAYEISLTFELNAAADLTRSLGRCFICIPATDAISDPVSGGSFISESSLF